MRGRGSWCALLAACAVLAAAPDARADGDPASDVLTVQDVYYGIALDMSSKPAAQLPELLATARKKGYPIKVVLITDVADLGIATFVWQKPQDYARYLGEELAFVYKERTLILMGNGYGYYRKGRGPGKERRVLAQLQPPGDVGQFLPRAIAAVRRLAAADGVRLAVPDVTPPAEGVPRIAGQSPAPAASTTPAIHNTVTPTPTATAKAAGGGSSSALLFLVPVLVFAGAAGAAMVVSRRRRPARDA
jgi:hypothetical protein